MTMIARLLTAVFLLSILVIGAPSNAIAQKRIALVIGNGTYNSVTQLPNPPNDAIDVSQSLKRLGFNVTTITDAKLGDFRHALIEFGRAARGADMAVLFFAGHGMEIMGDNWLLPVDVELKNDIDVDTEAVNLKSAMLAVSNAKGLGLVILDACRNNPFFGRMHRAGPTPVLDPGLAPVEPGENVLVAYAARDGTTASDGSGRNSPYTAALLHHLETPGLEIEFLFRDVRDDVMAATKDEQQPFVYGSLSSEQIYLKEGPSPQLAYNQSEVASDAGEIAWSFLKQTSDVGTLQRFVEEFPSSNRLPDAKERLASLESAAKPETDRTYLFETDADELDTSTGQTARPFMRNTPAVEAAWKVVRGTKDITVLKRFAEQFPSGQRRAEAQQRLTEIGAPIFQPDILTRAAEDPDVLQCYRANDLTAPECQRALQSFPDIGFFLYDFRFRFELCERLGGLGHCSDVWADLPSKPLFELANYPPHRPGFKEGDDHSHHMEPHDKHSKESTSHQANKERSSKQNNHHDRQQGKTNGSAAGSHQNDARQNKVSNMKPSGPNNAGHPSGGGGHH
jgi:uncharacterized caspase-like protein